MTQAAASDSLIVRFTSIIRGLRDDVSARLHQTKRPALLVSLLATRLNLMITRFTAIVARAAAAKPASRATVNPPSPAQRHRTPPDPAATSPTTPEFILPRDFGWLIRMVPPTITQGNAAGAGRLQIAQLLADPAMLALIASTPAAGRILRPLCRMLGIHLPEPLRLPRRPRPTDPATWPPRAKTPGRIDPPRPFPYPVPPRPPTPEETKHAIRRFFGDYEHHREQDRSPPDFLYVHPR